MPYIIMILNLIIKVRLLLTLNIAIARSWMFLWWIEIDLSVLRDLRQMEICHSKLTEGIFRVNTWFCYYYIDHVASILMASN